jgi:hypothetical protein
MIKLTPSTEQDIERITGWIAQDVYHSGRMSAEWWLTGNGLLSYRLQDDKGPMMYVRTDVDNDLMRLSTQFAPESEVSKLRVVKSLIWALPKMEYLAKQNQLRGFVYESTSKSLIDFMNKLGFIALDNTDDYVLYFDSENTDK